MQKPSNYLNLTRFYAFYIVTFLLIWLVFRYFTPLTLHVRHTYELPSTACTNELTSDLWTFEVVREGLMVLYILVPFSICLMIWSREKVAWGAHLGVVLVGMAWSIVNLGFDINDLKHANVSPDDPNFRAANLARDPQWCLFHGGQPNTNLICANTGICTNAESAVDPATFGPSGGFVLRFVFNILLLGSCVVALWAATVWRRAVLPAGPKQRVRYQTLATSK